MLIGSLIALRGGLVGEYLGMASPNAARVRIGYETRTVAMSLVAGKARRPPTKWPIGQAVTVELDGVTVAGVVCGDGPLVKVTERHPIWFGAVVGKSDGKIKRVEG